MSISLKQLGRLGTIWADLGRLGPILTVSKLERRGGNLSTMDSPDFMDQIDECFTKHKGFRVL